jgi:thiosulfate dehydrogenase
MAKAETLAAFALLNMPRGNPTLSTEQAVDVAAYVDSQPRPHFIKK